MLNGDSHHVRGRLTADIKGVWLDGDEDHIDIEGWEAASPSSVERRNRLDQRLLLGRGEGRGVGKNTPKRHLFFWIDGNVVKKAEK